jgi:hypothetical protein
MPDLTLAGLSGSPSALFMDKTRAKSFFNERTCNFSWPRNILLSQVFAAIET